MFPFHRLVQRSSAPSINYQELIFTHRVFPPLRSLSVYFIMTSRQFRTTSMIESNGGLSQRLFSIRQKIFEGKILQPLDCRTWEHCNHFGMHSNTPTHKHIHPHTHTHTHSRPQHFKRAHAIHTFPKLTHTNAERQKTENRSKHGDEKCKYAKNEKKEEKKFKRTKIRWS